MLTRKLPARRRPQFGGIGLPSHMPMCLLSVRLPGGSENLQGDRHLKAHRTRRAPPVSKLLRSNLAHLTDRVSQSVSLVYKHMGRHTVLQALSACADNMFGRSDAIQLKAAAKC